VNIESSLIIEKTGAMLLLLEGGIIPEEHDERTKTKRAQFVRYFNDF